LRPAAREGEHRERHDRRDRYLILALLADAALARGGEGATAARVVWHWPGGALLRFAVVLPAAVLVAVAVPVALAPLVAGVGVEVAGGAAGTLRISIALHAVLAVAPRRLRALPGARHGVAGVLRALVRREVALAAVALLVL